MVALLVGGLLAPPPADAGPGATGGTPGAAPARSIRRPGILSLAIRIGYVRYTGGGGSNTDGISLRFGVRIPDHRVAVMVRVSALVHTRFITTTSEVGLAVRWWAPGYHFFVEPHLGLAGYEPSEYDQRGASGLGAGLVVGLEVVHGRHVSLDLLAGAARDFLRDFDDEEHVWAALGGSVF